jgi:hypothetical protein
MKDSEFRLNVRHMRELQNAYFKTRDRDLLVDAKKAEATVDAELKKYFEDMEGRPDAGNMPKLF